MTEIPEHLLRRSKERRAALEGGAAAEGTAEATATVTEAGASAAPVPAGGAPATQTGGGGGRTPAAPRPAAPVPDAEPEPRYVPTRTKVPLWVMPVLAALPLWGIVYMGAFGNRVKANTNDPVAVGEGLYTANCATCHGAGGQGGVGPQLSSGQVLKVWPKLQDHINWVHTGGAPYVGKTIGATNIAVPVNNVMPAFGLDHGGTLTDLQIEQIVCYERVNFGGEPETTTNCPGFAG